MATLTRTKQVGLKVNTSRGVREASLGASDYARNVKNVTESVNVTQTQREINKSTLTTEPHITGPGFFEASWEEELAGGSRTTEPGVALSLKAGGYARVESGGVSSCKMMTLGTISGGAGAAFSPGQLIGDNPTQGSATKTGRVLGYGVVSGTRQLFFEALTGTFTTSDTVYNYGATPQASAPITANPVVGGHGYRPKTDSNDSAIDYTCEIRDGETVKIGVVKCSLEFVISHAEIPMVRVTARGPAVFQSTAKDFVQAGFVTGITLPPKPSFVMGDVVDAFKIGGFAPVITQMNVNLNATIPERKTIAEGGVIAYITEGLKSGYASPWITQRNTTGSIDPDLPAVGTFDMYQKWNSGAVMELVAQVGQLRTAGAQAMFFRGPKVQFEGNASQSDSDGIVKLSGSLAFRGDNDDEFEVWFLYA